MFHHHIFYIFIKGKFSIDLQNNYRSTGSIDFQNIYDTDLPVVSILRLSLRWHATGTTGSFVIYLEIDTTGRSVISPFINE
jgi:hypothetical protein